MVNPKLYKLFKEKINDDYKRAEVILVMAERMSETRVPKLLKTKWKKEKKLAKTKVEEPGRKGFRNSIVEE